MSKEIQIPYTSTGSSLYAVIRNSVGQAWNTSGTPAFETYTTANIADYAISLTEQGTASQFYAGDFPALSAGVYGVTIYEGASPTEGDTLVGAGNIEWDGSAVVSLTSRSSHSAGDVWDVTMASHLTGGTTGASLNAAGSAGDPWATSLPGAYSSGTAGFIVGTNLDTTVSSRLASGSYTAPDNAGITTIIAAAATITATLGTPIDTDLATDIANIQADTDDIQTRIPAALVSGRMDVSVGAYQTGQVPLQPTVAGNTLDVTATGEAGIDWGNVGSPATTVSLSNTTIKTVSDITGTLDIVAGRMAAILGKQTVPYEFTPDATGKSVYVTLADSSTGAAKTGLAYNSAGATASYSREGGTSSSFSLVDLAAPDSAWTSGGFKEMDSINAPGLYRLCVPNGALASGASYAVATLGFTGVITQDTLMLIRQSVSEVGAGATPYTIEVTDGSSGLEGASVWVTSDAAGDNVIAGTLTTNSLGLVTFYLDSGASLYYWVQDRGYTGTNPTAFTVP